MRDNVLIVGAGLAGLFLALKLAPRRVTVLSQAPLGQPSSSAWAQGGLAAALSPEDDPKLHAQDTIVHDLKKIIASALPASGFRSYSPRRMRSARDSSACSSAVENSVMARKSRYKGSRVIG